MKYKVLLVHPQDKSKNLEDETFAPTDQDLAALYGVMYPGYKIQIIERTNEAVPAGIGARPGSIPLSQQLANSMPEVAPNQGGGGGGGHRPGPAPSSITFKDGNAEYKMENGKIFKREWVKCDDNDIRIVHRSDPKTEFPAEDMIEIQKLQWTELKNEEKKP